MTGWVGVAVSDMLISRQEATTLPDPRDAVEAHATAWYRAPIRLLYHRLPDLTWTIPLASQTMTADPDLHLVVDGRILAPIAIEHGLYRFAVGPGAVRVCFRSRTAIPAHQDPEAGDERRLGVALNRIALRGRTLELYLPHDDPSLDEGFHPAEGGHRWTDGGGVIPPQWLRALQDGFTLEIEVNPSALRYVTDG